MADENGWEKLPPPATQAALLRDLAGNPFRLVTLPTEEITRMGTDPDGNAVLVRERVCPWCTSTVLALAQAAYDERQLVFMESLKREETTMQDSGTLDPDRLAVLADALEEAGCLSADLLAHLRGPGPHVRGCFALDLILGKE